MNELTNHDDIRSRESISSTNTKVWLGLGMAVGLGVGLLAIIWVDSVDPKPEPPAPTEERTRHERGSIDGSLSALARGRENDAPEIAAFYRDRGYAPCWTTPFGLNPAGIDLMRRLTLDDELGIRTDLVNAGRLAYVDFRPGVDRGRSDLDAVASLDWSLSEGLRQVALRLAHGRLDPSKVQPDWFHRDETLDVKAVLEQASERGPGVVLEQLRVSHEERTGLDAALALYESLDRAGGWAEVPWPGKPLERGTHAEEVIALRARLLATGDLASIPDGGDAAPDPSFFDESVERAVKIFQARHGLETDGRVGEETLEEMNVPSAVRVRQIRVNLERRRWLPGSFGTEYVWINVPEYRLYAFRDGRLARRMNVVVGKPQSPTPLFSELLRYVVFNPYWNVPESIALNELLPKQRSEPGYLPSRGYEVVDMDEVSVPVDDLTAEAITSGNLRIRRLPGRLNDLGQVKFMLPNEHDVYLHDTPSRSLFARPTRAFSHGCVRLEQPMDFASYVLEGRMGSPEIAQARRSAAPYQVDLDHPIRVYIVYFTAFVNDGLVNFRKDIYRYDDAVWLALERSKAASGSVRIASLEPR